MDTLNKNECENDPKDLNHKLFTEKMSATKYRLFISEFNSLDHELDEIIHKLWQAQPHDELEINIASPGGYTHDLMKMENIFKTKFYGRVTTILNPYGYSCGALVFLAGDERIIYENSELMFHNVALGSYGKLSDVETELKHNKKYFENYIKNAIKPYFTKDELSELLRGKEFWMDALEICERRIATKVHIFGSYMDAETYVKYRTDKKFKKELFDELGKIEGLAKKDKDFIGRKK